MLLLCWLRMLLPTVEARVRLVLSASLCLCLVWFVHGGGNAECENEHTCGVSALVGRSAVLACQQHRTEWNCELRRLLESCRVGCCHVAIYMWCCCVSGQIPLQQSWWGRSTCYCVHPVALCELIGHLDIREVSAVESGFLPCGRF